MTGKEQIVIPGRAERPTAAATLTKYFVRTATGSGKSLAWIPAVTYATSR